MANVTATTGTDLFTGLGGTGNTTSLADEILVTNQNQIQSGDLFDGGAGTDTLRLNASIDFTPILNSATSGIKNIEILRFNGGQTATFRSDQFGTGLLASNLTLRGTTGAVQTIVINMVSSAPTLNMSAWQFTNWTGGTDIISVVGSTAADTILVSSQHTRFDGGTGSDTVDYSTWSGGFSLTLSSSSWVTATWNSGLTDQFRNVENITGSTSADAITGDSLDNRLNGAAGDDILSGGAGNDTLDGGTGNDTMTGGVGDDIFTVDSTLDVVIERATDLGTDLVSSTVSFSAAGTNQDGIENITLTGTANIDATGNALANILTGNSGANVLTGGDGNDQLYGNGGLDTLLGGNGDDLLDGGTGADAMTGGVGSDIYYVDDAGDTVIDRVTDLGTDLVYSSVTLSAAGTNQDGIDNVTLTGTGNIDATGNALDNILVGNSGNNVLDGGLGADRMTGGAGNDTYTVDNIGDLIIELSSDAGTDHVFSSLTFSAAGGNQSGIENITLTGTSAINATGNALANVLTGNSANNILSGGDGNDTLIGGLGSDTLTGGSGADIFAFSPYDSSVAQFDVVTDFSIADGDRISLGAVGPATFETTANWLIRTDVSGNTILNGFFASNTQRMILPNVAISDLTASSFIFDTSVTPRVLTGGNGNTTLFGGLGDDILTGGNLNNILVGDAGNDTLIGNNLVDVLDGGTGADTMTGGLGNDWYYVDNVGDVVNESDPGQGVDRVYSTISFSLTGTAAGIDDAFLTGTADVNLTGNGLANRLTGNAGNNVLDGGSGNDVLDGGLGNDTLIGGAGNDTLTGGAGQDVFAFSGTFNQDTIRDFSVANDRLDLRSLGIDSAAELAPYASNSGSNLVLNFGGGNVVVMNGVQVSQIHDGMFVV